MWGSLMLAPRYTSYWGKRELAPPVELNVPPVYICTYVPVPGRPRAMHKRKVHPPRSGIRREYSIHL